jgi:cardiolipin synthase
MGPGKWITGYANTTCYIASALLLLLTTLPGCSGPREKPGEVSLDDYPTLPGRFAEEPVRVPLVALEAFIGDREFYVRYEGADGVVYAGGNWSDRIDALALEQGADETYTGPYILPLDYRQREPWAEVTESPIVPELLSSEQWGRFREQMFASLLPRTGRHGVVMHFDNDDYFLYYNEVDEFEARLLTDKPANYAVAERFDFSEFMLRARPQLRAFLQAEGITARRIVFNTGDAGAYSLPFLYVDIELPLAVFVRYAPAPKSWAAAESGTRAVQSVGHITQSHLGGLAVRPMSSIYRLLFVAGDAAVETVRPTWLVTLESQPVPEVADVPSMDLSKWEQQLDSLTGRSATKGTIDYLIDGEQYFTRLIDAITSASESILIRTYIFDNDDYAEKIGQLLRRRSAEGVEVRILLDGLGTILATGVDDASMPADHQAPESVRRFLEQDSDIEVRQVRNPWLAGDHVKTTVIDGTVAFTGGMNVGREYRYVWHDIMMEVHGPVVDILIKEFYDAWVHAGPFGDLGYFFHQLSADAEKSEDTGYPVRVLYTQPGYAEIFRAQLAAIRNARRYIYIQNAYFTDDAMLYELARARRRGVDVRVILPLVGNHGPINQSNVLAANAMLEHGIRVFLYPGMSHVKAAVFDGWACLGSANWDKLSFRTNKELNLATSHQPAVEELLQRVFAEDFSRSVELTEPFPENWSNYLYEVVADYLL